MYLRKADRFLRFRMHILMKFEQKDFKGGKSMGDRGWLKNQNSYGLPDFGLDFVMIRLISIIIKITSIIAASTKA